MSKRLIAFLVVLLFSSSVYAGDPWKDKPYKQWDQKDLRRIMTDSPWSKPVSVAKTWATDGPGKEYDPLGASGTAKSSDPKDILRGATPSGPAPAEAAFLVRWMSSRTIRRAIARLVVLRGAPETEADKPLEQNFPECGVAVFGPDMTPFNGATEKDLQENTYLVGKKSKSHISPGRVEIQRSTDGKRILAVYFSFPRKTPAGEPALATGEKGAEFVCQSGKVTLKAGFDLAKIVDSQGADL